METLLVGVIIACAAIFLVRKFYRAVAGRGKGGCGCGSCGCGAQPAAGPCREREIVPPCCRKP